MNYKTYSIDGENIYEGWNTVSFFELDKYHSLIAEKNKNYEWTCRIIEYLQSVGAEKSILLYTSRFIPFRTYLRYEREKNEIKTKSIFKYEKKASLYDVLIQTCLNYCDGEFFSIYDYEDLTLLDDYIDPTCPHLFVEALLKVLRKKDAMTLLCNFNILDKNIILEKLGNNRITRLIKEVQNTNQETMKNCYKYAIEDFGDEIAYFTLLKCILPIRKLSLKDIQSLETVIFERIITYLKEVEKNDVMNGKPQELFNNRFITIREWRNIIDYYDHTDDYDFEKEIKDWFRERPNKESDFYRKWPSLKMEEKYFIASTIERNKKNGVDFINEFYSSSKTGNNGGQESFINKVFALSWRMFYEQSNLGKMGLLIKPFSDEKIIEIIHDNSSFYKMFQDATYIKLGKKVYRDDVDEMIAFIYQKVKKMVFFKYER